MKKITITAIGVTGALIFTTAATALAAPSINKEQTENDTQTILSSSTAKSAPTELPERFQTTELPEGITIPESKDDGGVPEMHERLTPSESPEGEDIKPFREGSKFMSRQTPRLKPETKPEGEDMVPPEFEGIENIDDPGRPEFSEEDMPEDMRGNSAPDRQFGNEMPEDRQGMPEDRHGGRGGHGGSSDGMQRGNEPAL